MKSKFFLFAAGEGQARPTGAAVHPSMHGCSVHPTRSTRCRFSCFASEDVHDIPEARRAAMNVLLVDDISDMGKTFASMKRCLEALHFKRVNTAELVLKACTIFVPDFLAENDPSQDWIVFPWEFSS
jgi:hypothetical protein